MKYVVVVVNPLNNTVANTVYGPFSFDEANLFVATADIPGFDLHIRPLVTVA
jgi:hypothetical protein